MSAYISLLFLFASLAFAGGQKKSQKKHQSHSAHAHGAATLSVAFDGTHGKVEFRGAAEGILGFEYAPKADKDKDVLIKNTAKFENGISKMLVLDPKLKCQFKKEFIGQIPEGKEKVIDKHSEWFAKFAITCAESPLGSIMEFDFSKFKLLHDIDISILVDTLQLSAEFKNEPISVELK